MFKLEKKEKSTYYYNVSVTRKEFEKFIEEAYQSTKGKYAVEGFRKGKAPRKVIEQNYGEKIFIEDAFDKFISFEYQNILNDNKEIYPVTIPSVDNLVFDDKEVSARLIIASEPEVTLGAYTGLKIEAIKDEVKEEDIENEINQIRDRQARFVSVDREAKLGDFVVIDFVGKVDGKKFEGGSAEDYRLELGSHSFVDTFEDQIVGMHIGEKKTVKVTFPEQYTKELQGKKADFDVTLNKVEEKQLPELNDDFASNVSEFETFAEFKEDIKKHLSESLENRLKRDNENKLIEKVVENAEVDIPEPMIEDQVEKRVKDFESRLSYEGLNLEEYLRLAGKTMEEFQTVQHDIARDNIKVSLVLQAIVKKENLTVTDEEVDAKLEEIATKYNKTLQDYKKSLVEQDISYFKSDILMGKLVEFLKTNNTIE